MRPSESKSETQTVPLWCIQRGDTPAGRAPSRRRAPLAKSARATRMPAGRSASYPALGVPPSLGAASTLSTASGHGMRRTRRRGRGMRRRRGGRRRPGGLAGLARTHTARAGGTWQSESRLSPAAGLTLSLSRTGCGRKGLSRPRGPALASESAGIRAAAAFPFFGCNVQCTHHPADDGVDGAG